MIESHRLCTRLCCVLFCCSHIVSRCRASIALGHSRLLPICDALFIQSGHRRSLPILRKNFFLIESDGGHRIKRALYIGIKRLCIGAITRLSQCHWSNHYGDVIMDTMASQITSLTVVYSIVYSDADQRKHQSSASLAFVWGIHRGSVNSLHKWPVTRKIFPFDDVIMPE